MASLQEKLEERRRKQENAVVYEYGDKIGILCYLQALC